MAMRVRVQIFGEDGRLFIDWWGDALRESTSPAHPDGHAIQETDQIFQGFKYIPQFSAGRRKAGAA
jgi:hypothetical protein